MSPPGPPHPGPHGPAARGGHQPTRWFENEEKVRTLQEIGDRLSLIGSRLSGRGPGKGGFTLGRTKVDPPPECLFIIRYERMPKGELSLKLELQWDEDYPGEQREPTNGDLIIE